MRRFIPTFDEDFPTLILLGLMLLIPAAGLATADWASGMTLLYLVVICFATIYGLIATW